MKNLLQYILLFGGLYFLFKKFKSETKAPPAPAIQKKTQSVILD